MPRKQREYLLRFADQALNDLDRAFGRLELLERAYSSPVPLPEDPNLSDEDRQALLEAESHPQHAQMTRLIMTQLLVAKEWLVKFKIDFM